MDPPAFRLTSGSFKFNSSSSEPQPTIVTGTTSSSVNSAEESIPPQLADGTGIGLCQEMPSFKINSGRVVWGPTETAIEGAINAQKITQREASTMNDATNVPVSSSSSSSSKSSSSGSVLVPGPTLDGPESLRSAEVLTGGTIIQCEHCYVSRAAVGEWRTTPVSVSWELPQNLPPDDYVVVEPVEPSATDSNLYVDANGTVVQKGWGNTWFRKRDPLPSKYVWGYPQVMLVHHSSQDPVDLAIRVQKFGMQCDSDPCICYINRYDWGYHHRIPDAVKTILAQGGLRTPSFIFDWQENRSDFCFLDAADAVDVLKSLLKDVPKIKESREVRKAGAVRLLGVSISHPLSSPAATSSSADTSTGVLVQIPGREYELGWLIFDSPAEDAKLIGCVYDTYSSFATGEVTGLKVGSTIVYPLDTITERTAAMRAKYETEKLHLVETNAPVLQAWYDRARSDPGALSEKFEQLAAELAKMQDDGSLGKVYVHLLEESIKLLIKKNKDVYEPLFDLLQASQKYTASALAMELNMREQTVSRDKKQAETRAHFQALLTELGVPQATPGQVQLPPKAWNAPPEPYTIDEDKLRHVIEGLQKSGTELFQCWQLAKPIESIWGTRISSSSTSSSSDSTTEIEFDPFWLRDLEAMLESMSKEEEARVEERARTLVEKVNQQRKDAGELELVYESAESINQSENNEPDAWRKCGERREKRKETLMYAVMHDYGSKSLPQLAESMVQVGLDKIDDFLHHWVSADPNLTALYPLVRAQYRAYQNKWGRRVF